MRKIGGLRRRGLINTVGVVFALGILCVLLVTAVFSAYYYSSVEADMRSRANSTAEYISGAMGQNYTAYYQSCIDYANGFEDRNKLELQFIDANGTLVASSYGVWAGSDPVTSEVAEAMNFREIRTFRDVDPLTGERIIAVSCPMVYTSGEVIGVLRYVTSTRNLDMQILSIFLIALLALGGIMAVVLISSNYYVRSIIVPISQITAFRSKRNMMTKSANWRTPSMRCPSRSVKTKRCSMILCHHCPMSCVRH